jgi:hypothetical protein
MMIMSELLTVAMVIVSAEASECYPKRSRHAGCDERTPHDVSP